jgi:hypothetical protein
MHKLVPMLRYLSRFGEARKGILPVFDSLDDTEKMQKVALVLDNIILKENNYQEIFQLTLEQRINVEYLYLKTLDSFRF